MIVPVPLGGVNAILTEDVSNTVAVPMVGAPDIVVIDVDALEATDVPVKLVAVTEKVYGVFGVNPDIIIGDDEPVAITVVVLELLVTV